MNTVILVAHARKTLAEYLALADAIQRVGAFQPVVVCGATQAEVDGIVAKDNRIPVVAAFEGMAEFVKAHRGLSRDAVLDRILAFSPGVAADLYQHDYARLYDLEPEVDTPLRQIFLCGRISAVLDEYAPSHAFIAGGSDLLRNIVNQMARARGAESYRWINLEYMNPGTVGARIWFAADESYRPSAGSDRQFGYDADSVLAHVRAWIDGVRAKNHRLDGVARAEKFERISNGFVGAVRDIVGLLRRGGDRHISAYRLRSWWRRILTRHLATPWDAVPRPFVTFALCGILDWHINLRAGQIRDQLSVCQQIINAMPYGTSLVIREHPGQPGALPPAALRRFLRDNRGRAFFVTGDAPLMTILAQSRGLISINSTSLAEAAVFGYPAMSIGVGGYDWAGLTYSVERFEDIGPQMAQLVADPRRNGRAAALEETLSRLIQQSVPAPGTHVDVSDNAAVRNMLADAICKIVARDRARLGVMTAQ
ncbi:MAG: hypothetical protein C6Y20_10115 [Tagaea sp. CACIAM 22H2]|nr:hypothetical protein [Tagaea sp. CACIAM 22H2]